MIVTLMTDFGTADGYVGAIKGSIKRENPDIDLIDISHSVPPYDIRRAAYSLLTYYAYFPKGTVHLCVVDPGVGSDRTAMILESPDYYFVGPDNGLFDFIINQEPVNAFSINMNMGGTVSSTFHGRDLFAPAAASLAQGQPVRSLAAPLGKVLHAKTRFFSISGNKYTVEPLTTDRFGNIIFGLNKKDLYSKRISHIRFKDRTFDSLSSHYAQIPKNQPLCLWNSLEYFEIAVNQASAYDYFKPDFKRDKAYITVE